jgi:hypothetical protein
MSHMQGPCNSTVDHIVCSGHQHLKIIAWLSILTQLQAALSHPGLGPNSVGHPHHQGKTVAYVCLLAPAPHSHVHMQAVSCSRHLHGCRPCTSAPPHLQRMRLCP